MLHPVEPYTTNTLLMALADGDLALLKPHLVRGPLRRDQILVTANKPIDHIYFPENGVCSIVSVMPETGSTEVGIFGRDGFSGTCLLLGSKTSPYEAFVQVDGSTALRIEADRLLGLARQSETLQTVLLRYIQTVLVQAAQGAVVNAHHRIESRLARWLLMCHDRVDGDDIHLTHQFMGMMIAAQRSGVTVTLHILEGAGMIRSKRGKVIILDRDKLEELAGDGYGQPEAEYRRLIGPLGRPSVMVPFESKNAHSG
jgi:CRP-like cAMP-binding protein